MKKILYILILAALLPLSAKSQFLEIVDNSNDPAVRFNLLEKEYLDNEKHLHEILYDYGECIIFKKNTEKAQQISDYLHGKVITFENVDVLSDSDKKQYSLRVEEPEYDKKGNIKKYKTSFTPIMAWVFNDKESSIILDKDIFKGNSFEILNFDGGRRAKFRLKPIDSDSIDAYVLGPKEVIQEKPSKTENVINMGLTALTGLSLQSSGKRVDNEIHAVRVPYIEFLYDRIIEKDNKGLAESCCADLDVVKDHWNSKYQQQQMVDFDFSESYGEWLTRYWDNPKFQNILKGQVFYSLNKYTIDEMGQSFQLSDIQVGDRIYYYNSEGHSISSVNCISNTELEMLNKMYAGKTFQQVKTTHEDLTKGWRDYITEKQGEPFEVKRIYLTNKDLDASDGSNVSDKTARTLNTDLKLAVETADGKNLLFEDFYLLEIQQIANCYDRGDDGNYRKKSFYPIQLIEAQIKEYTADLQYSKKKAKEYEIERKQRKQEIYNANVQKYGATIANAIRDGRVVVGMNDAAIESAIRQRMGLYCYNNIYKRPIGGNTMEYSYTNAYGQNSIVVVNMSNGKVTNVVSQ